LKNDEVIDFLTSLPSNFSALKMFQLKCYSMFKNRLPHCRWCDCDTL